MCAVLRYVNISHVYVDTCYIYVDTTYTDVYMSHTYVDTRYIYVDMRYISVNICHVGHWMNEQEPWVARLDGLVLDALFVNAQGL